MKPSRWKSLVGGYRDALATYARSGEEVHLQAAYELGRSGLNAGLGVLDMVRLHQEALAMLVVSAPVPAATSRATQGSTASPRALPGLAKAIDTFLLEALSPFEAAHRGFRDACKRLNALNRTLNERNEQLATTNLRLGREITERKEAELALRESRQHYIRLFEEAKAMQDSLRRLSNKVLTAQEEERKHISRELHDEIGQTLTAANVSIALLRRHAESDPEFARKVESAQRLLEQSMDMVHRFARELRPSMLDHLGPFAALQNYVKSYSERTGLRVDLKNTARLEGLDVNLGTVLYRVAQESLTNVFKHAAATRVKIRLSQQADKVRMEIVDNGRGSDRILETAGAGQRIGVLGMQERVRLASGEFSIKSVPRRGTTVSVLLPVSPKLKVGGGSPPPNTTEPTGSIPHPS